jgi:hypothetical protein
MAAGAVVFTGGTGEEFAVHLENAIVLESSHSEEVAWYIRHLDRSPAVVEELTREARAASCGTVSSITSWSKSNSSRCARAFALASRVSCPGLYAAGRRTGRAVVGSPIRTDWLWRKPSLASPFGRHRGALIPAAAIS